MRTAISGLLFLGLFFSGCSRMPSTPEQAVARVDARIYYPQREGIHDLTAAVRCPHLDEHFQKKAEESADAALYLLEMLPLQIRFVWDVKEGGRYEYLSVPESEKELRAFLDKAFGGTEILVVPPTEEENFQPFNVGFGPWEDKYRLIGINKDSQSDFTKYAVIVDKTFKIVSKQYYSRDFVSTTVPSYREEGHHLLLTDLITLQKGTTLEQQVVSEVHLRYQQVQGCWLVQSLEYVFKERSKEGDKTFRGPLAINFSDYRINETGGEK